MSLPRWKRFGLTLTAISVLSLGTPRPSLATYPGSEEKVITAVKKARPSVVYIVTNRSGSILPAIGSGIIYSADGIILTNNHVVRRAQAIRVYLWNGQHYSARLLRASPAHDLAVIKIDASGLTAAHFGDSDRLELGQVAIAIGSPMKFRFSVSVGCISGLQRQQATKDVKFDDLIQTDAAINPGSSGGPLLNSNGDVVGVNSLVYTGDPQYPSVHPFGIAFAIPGNLAHRVAADLLAGKGPEESARPWLGIDCESMDADQAENMGLDIKSGVIVTAVKPDSPALSGGLKVKDVINKVNGKVVRTKEEFSTLIDSLKADETVELGVWRGGKFQLIRVKLEAPNATE